MGDEVPVGRLRPPLAAVRTATDRGGGTHGRVTEGRAD